MPREAPCLEDSWQDLSLLKATPRLSPGLRPLAQPASATSSPLTLSLLPQVSGTPSTLTWVGPTSAVTFGRCSPGPALVTVWPAQAPAPCGLLVVLEAFSPLRGRKAPAPRT